MIEIINEGLNIEVSEEYCGCCWCPDIPTSNGGRPYDAKKQDPISISIINEINS